MSSSRSIAAARNRRAGDPLPTQPQGRPMTSIASQSAFVQQSMTPNPGMGKNIRIGGGKTINQSLNAPQPPPINTNGLPFTKLSISDAIGLVTLRLGRVEQFIIDFESEGGMNGESLNIPENTKLIDNSVLTSIINRLDSLEKRESSQLSNNEQLNKFEKEIRFDMENLRAEIKEIKEDLLMINMDSTMIIDDMVAPDEEEYEEEAVTISS